MAKAKLTATELSLYKGFLNDLFVAGGFTYICLSKNQNEEGASTLENVI